MTPIASSFFQIPGFISAKSRDNLSEELHSRPPNWKRIFSLLQHEVEFLDGDLFAEALRIAAQHNEMDCFTLLLDEREYIPAPAIKSALETAAFYGSLECLRILLRKKSDVCHDFIGGALRWASSMGSLSCILCLLEARTDISAAEMDCAFITAAREGDPTCLDVLYQKQTPAHRIALTALFSAVMSRNSKCVQFLLQRCHFSDEELMASLILAERGMCLECIRLLSERVNRIMVR